MTRFIIIALATIVVALGVVTTADARWPWTSECQQYYDSDKNNNGIVDEPDFSYYVHHQEVEGGVITSTPCGPSVPSHTVQPDSVTQPDVNPSNPGPNGNTGIGGPGNGGPNSGGGSGANLARTRGGGSGNACVDIVSPGSGWTWWGRTVTGHCVFDLNAPEQSPIHYAVFERGATQLWTFFREPEDDWIPAESSSARNIAVTREPDGCSGILSPGSRWTWWGRTADERCVFDLNAPPARTNRYAVFTRGGSPVWTFFSAPAGDWIAAQPLSLESASVESFSAQASLVWSIAVNVAADGGGDCASMLSGETSWTSWGQTAGGQCVFDLSAPRQSPFQYVVFAAGEASVWTFFSETREDWSPAESAPVSVLALVEPEDDGSDCTEILSSGSRWTWWGRTASGQCVFDLNAPEQQTNQYAVFERGAARVWTFFSAPEHDWLAARAASQSR